MRSCEVLARLKDEGIAIHRETPMGALAVGPANRSASS
jgi:hypothetical protein